METYYLLCGEFSKFFVLILPMRNGNFVVGSRPKGRLVIVLILPMRNGNPMASNNTPLSKPVLILPMRNGN